jgi:hypothetical protein
MFIFQICLWTFSTKPSVVNTLLKSLYFKRKVVINLVGSFIKVCYPQQCSWSDFVLYMLSNTNDACNCNERVSALCHSLTKLQFVIVDCFFWNPFTARIKMLK